MLKSLVVLNHKRQNIYVACEDMDFVWDERDVCEIDRMWNEGLCLWDIARSFDRDPDEVAILVIDRTKQGFMKARPGGAYGRRRISDGKENSRQETDRTG